MKPALHPLAAKKRIRRFFDEPLNERRAVSHFIEKLSFCADVFVFGGALRDISLWGAPHFSSDVDMVVRVHDERAYFETLEKFEADQNKFGGYRLQLDRWNFDVWEVTRTWAFTVGAVEARSHLSLLETTFFNWDAILYDWQAASLHHGQKYFSDLSEKYLELVLEENPNHVGSFVRALRTLCISDEIIAGPRLSKFVKMNFGTIDNDSILAYEEERFPTSRLTSELLSCLRERADQYIRSEAFHWLPRRQLHLFDDFD